MALTPTQDCKRTIDLDHFDEEFYVSEEFINVIRGGKDVDFKGENGLDQVDYLDQDGDRVIDSLMNCVSFFRKLLEGYRGMDREVEFFSKENEGLQRIVVKLNMEIVI